MAIDLGRVVQATVEAATQDSPPKPEPKKPHLTVGRSILLGAGIVAAGRLIAGPKGRELFGSVQERIQDADWYEQDEEPEDFDDEEEDQTEDRPRSRRSTRPKQRSRS
jgi:hypothetical protein